MHGYGNACTTTVTTPSCPAPHVRRPPNDQTDLCTVSHLSGMGIPTFRVLVSAGNAHARTAAVHHSMPEWRRIADDYADTMT
jgi:hypothetical protein